MRFVMIKLATNALFKARMFAKRLKALLSCHTGIFVRWISRHLSVRCMVYKRLKVIAAIFSADEDVKVILCDLTCSQKKYVQPFTNSSGYHEGKRATAYRQIESTIDKLMDVPEIRNHFASMSSRVGLFAERNKDTVFRDVATQNMQLMMPDYMQGSNLNTDMGHGFEFVTVLYPQTYQW